MVGVGGLGGYSFALLAKVCYIGFCEIIPLKGESMAQVAVVTDGAAAMPPQLVEEHDIAVVPFQPIWEGESLRDGIDMTVYDPSRGADGH